jgi:hypothetical protein
MRRILAGFAAAAILAVVPTLVAAGNQEIADQIVRRLRDSGRMSDYSVGVTYKDGTARLRGRVASEEQMVTALKLAFQTPGVTSVINELSVAPSETGQSGVPIRASSGRSPQDTSASRNPLRNRTVTPVAEDAQQPGQARRLESWSGGSDSEPNTPASADRGSSSYFSPAGVKTVSAEEWQREAPEKMPMPQRVKPMDPSRVAMSQPMVRGPVASGGPLPMYASANGGGGTAPARYDQPCLPNYAWPSYAAYPNYAAVTYPKQYSPTAWPYIGPFYPYPQVPLGWRKVTLEWDDGWWFLDFKDQPASCWHR